MVGGGAMLSNLGILKLYGREVAGVTAGLAGATLLLGVMPGALVGLAGAAAFLYLHVRRKPWLNRGHRAGSEGYKGPTCENTIEALESLIAQDNRGLLANLQYVEIDVQETADGHLVVVHDSRLLRTFPQLATAAHDATGADLSSRTIQDMTLEQLQGLDVGGRPGVKLPTLQAFMEACQRCGIQRPLVVEVKALQTDGGCMRLLDLLRWYKREVADKLRDTVPERSHDPFGFLGVIAFPAAFASSFGPFGSSRWQIWSTELEALQVPARCCFFHHMALTHGAARSGHAIAAHAPLSS